MLECCCDEQEGLCWGCDMLGRRREGQEGPIGEIYNAGTSH